MNENISAAPLEAGHVNWMAGTSYSPSNPLVQLRMAAASCFFGEPSYYAQDSSGESGRANGKKKAAQSSRSSTALSFELVQHLLQALGVGLPLSPVTESPARAMERAIDQALDFSPEGTLRVAQALRQEDHIRVTPQVIMVRAANHAKVRGTELIRTFAPQILSRADEPAIQLAYQLKAYGQPIPNSLKRAWKLFLEQQGEYQLAKYRQQNGFRKTLDVVNLVHAKSEAISKLMKNELTLNESTWESLISAKGSSATTWKEALEKFLLNPKGHMALLRNLRNLAEHNLLDAPVLEALKAGVVQGRQLPFRYWSAYMALKGSEHASGAALDAIEQCLLLSLANTPKFEGKVMSLCDNSGSAQGAFTSELGKVAVNHIANLSGVITGMSADDGYVGVFGDGLEVTPVRKASSFFDQVELLNGQAESIGTGTENGVWLFWDKAIRKKEHWDHVFVYSDMQAGHGGLYGLRPSDYADFLWPERGERYIDVARLVAEYRRTVNPNVMVYLVQVAGYQDTLVPDVFDKTVIIGGWGPGLLRYAKQLADLQAPSRI